MKVDIIYDPDGGSATVKGWAIGFAIDGIEFYVNGARTGKFPSGHLTTNRRVREIIDLVKDAVEKRVPTKEEVQRSRRFDVWDDGYHHYGGDVHRRDKP